MNQVLAGLRQEAVACLAANDVHTVASERCARHPAAAGFASPRPAVGVETQHEDDESHDVWQAVFDNVDEVQKSVLRPCSGAMSVHKEHRIFHHRGVMVCVKMWRTQHAGQRKLRRDCPEKPSKLGVEVLKRMANRETPPPGQELPFSVDVAPPTRMVVARVWTRRGPPCAMPDPAWQVREGWTRARVRREGGGNGPFLLVEQRCPWSALLAF